MALTDQGGIMGEILRPLLSGPKLRVEPKTFSVSLQLRELMGDPVDSKIRRELETLLQERDPELFWESSLAFARRQQQRGDLETAAKLYGFVAAQADAAFPKILHSAQRELNALVGRGAFGSRAEFLLTQFTKQATDYRTILPMLAGAGVFNLTRTLTLGRLAISEASWFTRGLGARVIAGTAGFFLEAPTFSLLGRALQDLSGEPVAWSSTAVGHDLAGSVLTLGALKAFAFLGNQAFLKVHAVNELGMAQLRGFEKFSQQAMTQTASLAGMLVAHKLETKLGLRPEVDGATALTDNLASLISLGVGGELGRRMLGSGYARWETELNLRGQLYSDFRPGGKQNAQRNVPAYFGELAPAFAAGTEGTSGKRNAPVPNERFVGPLLMENTGGTPPLLSRAEAMKLLTLAKQCHEWIPDFRSMNPAQRQQFLFHVLQAWARLNPEEQTLHRELAVTLGHALPAEDVPPVSFIDALAMEMGLKTPETKAKSEVPSAPKASVQEKASSEVSSASEKDPKAAAMTSEEISAVVSGREKRRTLDYERDFKPLLTDEQARERFFSDLWNNPDSERNVSITDGSRWVLVGCFRFDKKNVTGLRLTTEQGARIFGNSFFRLTFERRGLRDVLVKAAGKKSEDLLKIFPKQVGVEGANVLKVDKVQPSLPLEDSLKPKSPMSREEILSAVSGPAPHALDFEADLKSLLRDQHGRWLLFAALLKNSASEMNVSLENGSRWVLVGNYHQPTDSATGLRLVTTRSALSYNDSYFKLAFERRGDLDGLINAQGRKSADLASVLPKLEIKIEQDSFKPELKKKAESPTVVAANLVVNVEERWDENLSSVKTTLREMGNFLQREGDRFSNPLFLQRRFAIRNPNGETFEITGKKFLDTVLRRTGHDVPESKSRWEEGAEFAQALYEKERGLEDTSSDTAPQALSSRQQAALQLYRSLPSLQIYAEILKKDNFNTFVAEVGDLVPILQEEASSQSVELNVEKLVEALVIGGGIFGERHLEELPHVLAAGQTSSHFPAPGEATLSLSPGSVSTETSSSGSPEASFPPPSISLSSTAMDSEALPRIEQAVSKIFIVPNVPIVAEKFAELESQILRELSLPREMARGVRGLSPLAKVGLASLLSPQSEWRRNGGKLRGDYKEQVRAFLNNPVFQDRPVMREQILETVARLYYGGVKGLPHGFVPTSLDAKFLSEERRRVRATLAEYEEAFKLATQTDALLVKLGARLPIDWSHFPLEEKFYLLKKAGIFLQRDFEKQREVEIDILVGRKNQRGENVRRLVEVKVRGVHDHPGPMDVATLLLQAFRHSVLVRQNALEGVEYVFHAPAVPHSTLQLLQGVFALTRVPYLISLRTQDQQRYVDGNLPFVVASGESRLDYTKPLPELKTEVVTKAVEKAHVETADARPVDPEVLDFLFKWVPQLPNQLKRGTSFDTLFINARHHVRREFFEDTVQRIQEHLREHRIHNPEISSLLDDFQKGIGHGLSKNVFSKLVLIAELLCGKSLKGEEPSQVVKASSSNWKDHLARDKAAWEAQLTPSVEVLEQELLSIKEVMEAIHRQPKQEDLAFAESYLQNLPLQVPNPQGEPISFAEILSAVEVVPEVKWNKDLLGRIRSLLSEIARLFGELEELKSRNAEALKAQPLSRSEPHQEFEVIAPFESRLLGAGEREKVGFGSTVDVDRFGGREFLVETIFGLLEKFHLGSITRGNSIPIDLQPPGKPALKGTLAWVGEGEKPDGVDWQADPEAAGKVIFQVRFQDPIGREGVQLFSEQQDIPLLPVDLPEKERWNRLWIADGRKPITRLLYLVGSPSTSGNLRLERAFSGRYVPSFSDTHFWGRHALLTGSWEPTFGKLSVPRFWITEGSLLHRSLQAGWMYPAREALVEEVERTATSLPNAEAGLIVDRTMSAILDRKIVHSGFFRKLVSEFPNPKPLSIDQANTLARLFQFWTLYDIKTAEQLGSKSETLEVSEFAKGGRVLLPSLDYYDRWIDGAGRYQGRFGKYPPK